MAKERGADWLMVASRGSWQMHGRGADWPVWWATEADNRCKAEMAHYRCITDYTWLGCMDTWLHMAEVLTGWWWTAKADYRCMAEMSDYRCMAEMADYRCMAEVA
eukprot:11181879-Lingulodinium_polyedra.AAC.1